VTTALPLSAARRIIPDGDQPLELVNGQFSVEINAWDGMVVEI
jgi:hypothetical protein